ncbi:MAG TPA: PLP-dependent aminotransferase family protein [Acidimicrobiales bacterium]|nr:PLP-dependent aminotransferase family protein [Acidimicrobiales bacterium]
MALSGGPGPLHRQLARSIAGAIERGELERGARLPAERALAASVPVSRGTAVAAYDLLMADGLVERRRGSGTFVLGAGVLGLPPGREGSALVHRLVDRSASASDVVDLSISVLHDAAGLPSLTVSTDDLADTGYSPWGLPSLRAALAAHVTSWGLPTTAEQIVVTTGAQQGIAAAAACWVRPGDVVAVDDPTYPGAIAAFTAAGARLVGMRVDGAGVVPDSVERALAEAPSLVYLQSTLHSPTGVVLSGGRREAIASLLREARVPVVEDCALHDLAWSPADVPPPLASWLGDGSVAVVGSLSKVLWGGLRVGFVRAPEPVALRFARVKATHDLGSSVVSQVLADRLLRDASLVSWRCSQLRERYDVLAGELRRGLPSWTWDEPAGGLSLWVRIGADAEPFAQRALEHGVAVATAQPLSPTPGAHVDRVRLSFAASPEELVEGVRRLSSAWATDFGTHMHQASSTSSRISSSSS